MLSKVMHELSIAENIFEIVRENLPSNRRAKVRTVKVRIGELAGVIPDSLVFCFGAIAKGTEMEGAVLNIERAGIVAHCTTCRREFKVERLDFKCPECGSIHTKVISGNELQVVEVDVDDDQ